MNTITKYIETPEQVGSYNVIHAKLNGDVLSTFPATSEHFMPLSMIAYEESIRRIALNDMQYSFVAADVFPALFCNNRCYWCFHEEILHSNNDSAELAIESLKPLLEDLRFLGIKGLRILGGGEPTLYKNFEYLLDEINATGLITTLITNGTLLKKYFKPIADVCNFVRVSLDAGSEESRKKVHGVSDYNNIISGLTLLAKQLKYPQILGVTYILDQHNLFDIYECCNRLASLGVNIISFRLPKKFKDGLFDSEIVSILRKQLYLARQDFSNLKIIVRFRLNENVEPFEYGTDIPFCLTRRLRPLINVAGSVQACNSYVDDKNWSYGKLSNNRFSEIVEQDMFMHIMQRKHRTPCKDMCCLENATELFYWMYDSIIKTNGFVNFVQTYDQKLDWI